MILNSFLSPRIVKAVGWKFTTAGPLYWKERMLALDGLGNIGGGSHAYKNFVLSARLT